MNNSEKNILLVDDAPNNIQLLGTTLRNEGYGISFATSGAQAIDLASRSRFDLILLDIMMPEMDGFQVFEIMQRRGSSDSVPVIFLTAKTDSDSILKAFSLGAVDYIIKPFQSSEVLARVRTQLELAESRAVLIETNRKLTEEIALRKEQEIKLKESEAIYRRLVESVPAIVYSFSDKRGRTFISPKVREILGYDVSDFNSNRFLWRESVHPEDRKKYLDALERAISGAHYDMKYRIKDVSGEWHWLLDRSFGMHTHSENGMRCVEGIAIDITEQERVENELRKLVKLEAAGLFAGGIAHDMNNLNCVVSGNIELARDDLKPEDPVNALLDEAFEAVQRQTRLIKQLSTLTEGFRPRKSRDDIVQMVRECALSIRNDIKSDIKISASDNLWAVIFDKTMIKSAFESIIHNADESMILPGELSGVIEIEVYNSDSLSMNHEIPVSGKYVVLSVTDHGVGIPENEQSIIFDPYYSKKSRGTKKGMGLGLTMALAIVQKHDGYIFVRSEEGKGSCFSIYLPAEG